jgi:transposase-like protein
MARSRRTYTPEFKAGAVKLVTAQGYSVAEAARPLGLNDNLIRNWKQALQDKGEHAFPGHFTPMFSYERSVAYPQGHRNCVFARRGVRTLPRLSDPDSKQPAGIHADDTKMLYRYLKEMDGICASHTSATGMGTDWRDNDPRVEPVVEIYQGDRMNYEHQGAPRSGYDPKGDRKPFQIGWEPKGFIDHALKEQGYRLGFQSSSDHWSTHISFCVVLAEKHDRQGILDGLKKRHVYGATDDIILDVRSGVHLMGDEFRTNVALPLEINVIGTGTIARIDFHRRISLDWACRHGCRRCRRHSSMRSPAS